MSANFLRAMVVHLYSFPQRTETSLLNIFSFYFQKMQKSVKVFFAEIVHEDEENSPKDDKENMDDTAIGVRAENAEETEQNRFFFAKFLMDCIEEDIY